MKLFSFLNEAFDVMLISVVAGLGFNRLIHLGWPHTQATIMTGFLFLVLWAVKGAIGAMAVAERYR